MWRFLSVLILVTNTLPLWAQTCDLSQNRSAPDDRFMIASNGYTVLDKQTGLIWLRCALGTQWRGGQCTGTLGGYSWSAALSAAQDATVGGYGDWRLPSINELSSVIELACLDPAINMTVFPNAKTSIWSSTVDLSGTTEVIDFYDGRLTHFSRATQTTGTGVLIVRGAE